MYLGPTPHKISYMAPKTITGLSYGLCHSIVPQYNLFPRLEHPIPLRVPEHIIVDAPIWIVS
jgi:hypothetical protein